MSDAQNWLPWLKEVGFPIAFAAAMFWYVLLPVTRRHMQFIDSVEKVLSERAGVTDRIEDGVSRLGEAMAALTESHVNLANAHAKLAEDVRLILRRQSGDRP